MTPKSKAVKQAKGDGSYSKETLHHHWSTGKPMKHEKVKYGVHKMSYGDYFLEPHGKSGGERDAFAKGTKWMERHPDKKDHYRVNTLLSD